MRSKDEVDDATWDVAGRIRSLEMFTGALVAAPHGGADVIPIHPLVTSRVPEPRRSRVFLRSGGGHGTFAQLTVMAPQPRRALD